MTRRPDPTAKPYNALTLIDWCKRRLGDPVVKVNVDDQQCADLLASAIQWLTAFSSDFQTPVYIKHKITDTDVARGYIDMSEVSGSGTTVNGANTVVGFNTDFTNDFAAGVTRITINGETHDVASVPSGTLLYTTTNWAANNDNQPITVVQEAARILSIKRILPLGTDLNRDGLFDYRYQYFLNNIWNFTSLEIAPYVMMREHLELINMFTSGNAPIRFTKNQNKLFLDIDWNEAVNPGQYILVEAWAALNPDTYTSIYDDKYLKRYLTALLKRQWGVNMSKYTGMPLPGGLTVNADKLMADADKDIEKLEEEIRADNEEPPMFLVG